MSLYDGRDRYGVISRFNHWLSAVIVITMLGIGLYFHEMPKGDERSYWMHLHIGIGALAFLFLLFRVGWRYFTTSPQPVKQSENLQKLTRVVHSLMLMAILFMIVSGPLIIWTAGRAIEVFGWFSIPSPLPEMHSAHEFLEGVHIGASRFLLVAIVIHVLAALKHAFIDHDEVMARMAGPDRRGRKA